MLERRIKSNESLFTLTVAHISHGRPGVFLSHILGPFPFPISHFGGERTKISGKRKLEPRERPDVQHMPFDLKIIRKISNGATLHSIARDLDIGKRTLDAVIAYMEHNGYIEEIPCRSRCGICNRGCLPKAPVKMYGLTLRGVERLDGLIEKER